MKFKNRAEAGRMLAGRLGAYKNKDVVVLGIPMGGVPVAYEIAREMKAPLDVVMAKKIGAPFNPELAIGAVTWNGAVLLDEDMVNKWQISREYVGEISRKLIKDMNDRLSELRVGQGSFPKLFGRTVIIVDDGIATGATMRVAVRAARKQRPGKLIVAAPVGAPESCAALRTEADEVICLAEPEYFGAVGSWYRHFAQTEDDDVERLLAGAAPVHARP